MPAPLPDCHLVRTAIPCAPRLVVNYKTGQPRCFPPQSNRLLASFAGNISKGNRVFCYGHNKIAWFPYPHLPLKAGYTAHSTQGCSVSPTSGFRPEKASEKALLPTHRNTGSRLIRTKSAKGFTPRNSPAQEQVSTKTGSGSPCHWGSP